MALYNTPNRNYVFPLKDEDLETSNNVLKISFDMIDTDVQNLVDVKADKVDTIDEASVDQKINTAIQEYDSQLDIYGTYDGDVYTDPNSKTTLLLKDVFSNPGTYTKVTVNSKGLITYGDYVKKSDITDFIESDYLHTIDLDDSSTAADKLWSAQKINNEIQGLSNDVSGSYVLISDYEDADVLAKIQNVDGAGSGLDADLLDGQQGSYYLDWVNFTGKPTTISGYGITDAYTKTEVDAKTWDWSSDITGKPTTLAGYGITDNVSINSVSSLTSSSSTVTLDLTSNEVFSVSVTQDVTIAVSNLTSSSAVGRRGKIVINQDSIGRHTVSFTSDFKFSGGNSSTTTTANAIDVVDFVVVLDPNGTGNVLLCDLSTNYS